jgi:hypothetical protein
MLLSLINSYKDFYLRDLKAYISTKEFSTSIERLYALYYNIRILLTTPLNRELVVSS